MQRLQRRPTVTVENNIRRRRPAHRVYYGVKHIATDALSGLPYNENQDTTHELMCTSKTMPELYDINELKDGMFHLYFKLINCYQWEDPLL